MELTIRNNFAANEAKSLVDSLYRGKRSERQSARSVLLDGSHERISALTMVIRRENQSKVRRFLNFTVLAYLMLLPVRYVLVWAIHLWFGGDEPAVSWLWTLMGAGALGLYFAPTRLQKQAVRALSNYEEIEALPALLDSLELQDPPTTRAIREALTRLLPRVRPSHLRLFEDRHLDQLRGLLTSEPERVTIAAILAIEQIGDDRFLPAMRNIAHGRVPIRGATVRQAARDCFPALERRVETESQGKLLLRPSMRQNARANDLVRPAKSPSSNGEEVLLRSSEVPERRLDR